MSTISLNNGTAMNLRNFNKQTRYDNGALVKTANFVLADAADETAIENLMGVEITSIVIVNDNSETIYSRTGLQGHINNMSAHVYDQSVSIEVYMTF